MRRLNKGFSLVELMIVVAIIGILAAIAIPNFISMQLKAKRSEIPGNLDGIKTAQVGYGAENDAYLALAAAPRATPDKALYEWTTASDWSSLGWKPDGQVRGVYSATAVAEDFTVYGESDVDGDTTNAVYTATSSINAKLNTAADIY